MNAFSLYKNRVTCKKIGCIPVFLVFVVQGWCQNIDIDLLKKINTDDVSSQTFKSMRFITHTAAEVNIGMPVILFTAGAIAHNGNMTKKAIFMGESLLVTELVTAGTKHAVNRPRPFVTYPFIIKKADAGSPSFPSGHTSVAFASATSVSIAYPRWYVIVPAFAYAGLVGYSRMYLGVHYPSDVLAGAVVGSGSAWLTYEINNWLHHSKHKNLSTAW